LGGKHVHALIGKHSSEDDLGGFGINWGTRKFQHWFPHENNKMTSSTWMITWGSLPFVGEKHHCFFNSEDFAARLPAPEGLNLLDTAIQPLLLCILWGRWLYPVIRLESGKGSW